MITVAMNNSTPTSSSPECYVYVPSRVTEATFLAARVVAETKTTITVAVRENTDRASKIVFNKVKIYATDKYEDPRTSTIKRDNQHFPSMLDERGTANNWHHSPRLTFDVAFVQQRTAAKKQAARQKAIDDATAALEKIAASLRSTSLMTEALAEQFKNLTVTLNTK